MASPSCFLHPVRGIECFLHGDDFLFCGEDAALGWVAAELANTILLKSVGKLGDDAARAM